MNLIHLSNLMTREPQLPLLNLYFREYPTVDQLLEIFMKD